MYHVSRVCVCSTKPNLQRSSPPKPNLQRTSPSLANCATAHLAIPWRTAPQSTSPPWPRGHGKVRQPWRKLQKLPKLEVFYIDFKACHVGLGEGPVGRAPIGREYVYSCPHWGCPPYTLLGLPGRKINVFCF